MCFTVHMIYNINMQNTHGVVVNTAWKITDSSFSSTITSSEKNRKSTNETGFLNK